MEKGELKRTIEAILFVIDKPLGIEDLEEVTGSGRKEIREAIDHISGECEERTLGFRLVSIAGGYQMMTDTSVAEHVRKFVQLREKRKLSQASLETLSIIAYKQPITRAEIELIRGVNIDGMMRTLIEKGLIRPVGHKEAPGNPILYGTTKSFLDHFGLGCVKDLPLLKEFTEKDIELPESLKPIEPEAEKQSEEEKHVKEETSTVT